MASEKSKKLREAAKKRKRVAAERAAAENKTRKMTPADITDGFSSDILQLMQIFSNARMHVKQRIRVAEEMKEKNPERFNLLRVDAFREMDAKMEEIQKKVDECAGIVGTMADMTTMHEKMMFVSRNFGNLHESQIAIEQLGRELTEIDMRFNQQITELMTPANLDDPQAAMEFIGAGATEVCSTIKVRGTRKAELDTPTHFGFHIEHITDPEQHAVEHLTRLTDSIPRALIISEGQDENGMFLVMPKDASIVAEVLCDDTRLSDSDTELAISDSEAKAIVDADQQTEAAPATEPANA